MVKNENEIILFCRGCNTFIAKLNFFQLVTLKTHSSIRKIRK
jgi:hypothetical protein